MIAIRGFLIINATRALLECVRLQLPALRTNRVRNKWKHEEGWIQLFQQRQKIPDDSSRAGKITASENNGEKQDTEG